MQLAEAKVFGAIDNQGVGIRNIDSGFDDRGRYQDVELLLPEVDNHLLERSLGHLPVGNGYAGLGHELGQIAGHLVDALNAVVNKEHLALANQLSPNSSGDLLLAIAANEGENRVSFFGRGCQSRHFSDARYRHLECSRNRSSRHRKNIDVELHGLELLFVLNSETLFFVNDD